MGKAGNDYIICNKDFLPNYVLLGMLGATVGSAISVSFFIIKSLFPTNPLKDLKSKKVF
ncbi:MAG: hypothetical protein OXC92_03725 [Flavobacteriaceae bacterium]|nr:hypothetical protein [Flavobacteriaceae bacterium]MCY4267664.1 hypothetical protein [Flavobacteriaceae bacterium]